MSKVQVTKKIGDLIENAKEGREGFTSTMYWVLDELDDNDLKENNLTIVDLAFAITEGYEVRKEVIYFTEALREMGNGQTCVCKLTNLRYRIKDGSFESSDTGGISWKFDNPHYAEMKSQWHLL